MVFLERKTDHVTPQVNTLQWILRALGARAKNRCQAAGSARIPRLSAVIVSSASFVHLLRPHRPPRSSTFPIRGLVPPGPWARDTSLDICMMSSCPSSPLALTGLLFWGVFPGHLTSYPSTLLRAFCPCFAWFPPTVINLELSWCFLCAEYEPKHLQPIPLHSHENPDEAGRIVMCIL